MCSPVLHRPHPLSTNPLIYVSWVTLLGCTTALVFLVTAHLLPRWRQPVIRSPCLICRLHEAQFSCPCSCWVWSDLGQSSSRSFLKPLRWPDIKSYQKPRGPLLVSWCSLSAFQHRGHHTNLANIVRTPEASLKISQVLQKPHAKSLRPVTYPFSWHQMPCEIKQRPER